MNNPLLDYEFLDQLMSNRQREIYARITLLTQDELPIEYIEGRVTGGSINVDGTSALRRTCNLTMILWDQQEINQFNWTFKSKFKLEIGLKNMIEPKYPDIIWFKQGIFVLTTCNMNQTTNNYTITINGKDKMCLLNGDLAGALPHSTDFGVLEEIDEDNNITYTKYLIKEIIYNVVQVFGGELPSNIIINDLDQSGLELLEYRGDEDTPLYLFRKVSDGSVSQVTLDGSTPVQIKNGSQVPINHNSIIYATTSNLINNDDTNNQPTIILWGEPQSDYNIMKFEYGTLAGYRTTNLTYAGDLKANVGETLVSVLDKIKNMLSDFEYFYNLDGKFVFQKKQTYVATPWGGQEKNSEDIINQKINDSFPKVSLHDAQLTTAFANNPNILNVKNDFSVWGTYKSISGADVPIHMRYAIDTKPTKYTSLDGTIYSVDDGWDWREIIYQMARDYNKDGNWKKDDFHLEIAAANPDLYPLGKTGYEQYYIDIEGFWRQLYDPNPEATYEEILAEDIENNDNLYIQNYYCQISEDELNAEELFEEIDNLYVLQENEIKSNQGETTTKKVFYPFIRSSYCCLDMDESDNTKSKTYYWATKDTYAQSSDPNLLNTKSLKILYSDLTEDGELDNSNLVIKQKLNNILEDRSNISLWRKIKEEKILFSKYEAAEIIDDIKNKSQYMIRWNIDDNYGTLSTTSETKEYITYLFKNDNGEYNSDHWHQSVTTDPDKLVFWFDFLDIEGSDLYKYSVKEIGSRTKAINDSNVKSIYYRDVPNIIFVKNIAEKGAGQTGYTYIQISDAYQSLFSISGRGKSAKERIDELLQDHSYAIEQTNITCVPLYHLEPNTRVLARDEKTKVDGEYIVNKVTIPLAYNGTMSLSTTKVVSNIM